MIFDKQGNVDFNQNIVDDSLIMEGAILDTFSTDEIEQLVENHYDLTVGVNEEYLEEATIVRLDKKAKRSRAKAVAVFTIAREKKDKDMKKLMTLWKLEKFLETKLFKRYGAQADARVKKTAHNATKSKSKAVATAAKKVKTLFNK